MRLPSKIISYKESVFPAVTLLITLLKQQDLSVLDVCLRAKERAVNISESFQALDVLFALGKISFDTKKEALRYVG